jgi:hypothetical protein
MEILLVCQAVSSLPVHVVTIYYYAAKMLMQNKQLLRLARWRLSACDQACEEAPCLDSLRESIQTLMAGLAVLLERTRQVAVFLPLRRLVADTMSEWEEVSEDVAISSDPEIRSLIFKISDAV